LEVLPAGSSRLATFREKDRQSGQTTATGCAWLASGAHAIGFLATSCVGLIVTHTYGGFNGVRRECCRVTTPTAIAVRFLPADHGQDISPVRITGTANQIPLSRGGARPHHQLPAARTRRRDHPTRHQSRATTDRYRGGLNGRVRRPATRGYRARVVRWSSEAGRATSPRPRPWYTAGKRCGSFYRPAASNRPTIFCIRWRSRTRAPLSSQ